MIDGIAERRADARIDEVRTNFITSHRATAACARELARLHDAIADGLETWGVGTASAGDDASLADAPVVRRTPARCLVQVGPVALTVAWLQRAQGTVADGELLVVVWRGCGRRAGAARIRAHGGSGRGELGDPSVGDGAHADRRERGGLGVGAGRRG